MSLSYDEAHKEFLEQQRTGIGSTDTPKILGTSRHGTALTVYQRIVEGEDPERSSLPAWLGLKLQSTVAELYTAKIGKRIIAVKDERQYRHPEYEWLVCHVDYRSPGRHPRYLVECKTRAYQTGWGDDGTDVIPDDVWMQVQHQMMVTGAERVDVAVLFGHFRFHVYPILRHDEFIDKLIVRLNAWWDEHVVAHVPPEPTGNPADGAVVRRRYRDSDGQIRSTTPEQDRLVNRLRIAHHNKKQANVAFLEAENKVIDLIGQADGITGPYGTITFRRTADYDEVNYQAAAYKLQLAAEWLLGRIPPPDNELDRALFDQAAYVVYNALQEATTHVQGHRRMAYRWTEEE